MPKVATDSGGGGEPVGRDRLLPWPPEIRRQGASERGDFVAGTHQAKLGGLLHCRQRHAALTRQVGLLREFLGRGHDAPGGYVTEGTERRGVKRLFENLPPEEGVGTYGFRHDTVLAVDSPQRHPLAEQRA
ncbi:hypothetical protein [Streptomyces sp. NPDC048295]|uniref:hypothetical protein n=1 Tax=Streptomyces sp. NPDC048295 TaxID=3154617 RepID=UPI00342BE1D6